MNRMWEILSNNWHIILSVILAGLSVIVLHMRKEKKANDAAVKIEEKIDSVVKASVDSTIAAMRIQYDSIATEMRNSIDSSTSKSTTAIDSATLKIRKAVGKSTTELKKETDKLTNALNYSILVLKMEVTIDTEPWKFEGKWNTIPEYLVETYQYELTISDGEGASTFYSLAPDEIDISIVTLREEESMRNYIYAWRHMMKGTEIKFTMYLKFELQSDLNSNFEKLKQNGSLNLLFKEKPLLRQTESYLNNKDLAMLVWEKLQLNEGCSIRFNNDREWSLFDFEQRSTIDGAMELGYNGYRFSFKNE